MTDLERYLDLTRKRFVGKFTAKDLAIVATFPRKRIDQQTTLLVTRRAGEGEPDIFCGYYKDGIQMKAVYFTLHPSGPLMILDRERVKTRVENLRRQNLAFDQSHEALENWPKG